MELNQQSAQPANISIVTSIVNFCVQSILLQTEQKVKQKQLLSFVSQYSNLQISNIFDLFAHHFTPNYGTVQPSKIQEENLVQIIKIQKDNLSPKQLPSDRPQKQLSISNLPQNLSELGTRKLSSTNRSSFLKRKVSQISQIPSITGTQKNRINNFDPNKDNIKQSNGKKPQSLKKQKDPLLNFTVIQVPETEDPQIVHFREKVQFNQKQKQKQLKIHSQRLKLDQQKIQKFLSNYGENNNEFTFDFDGQTFSAQWNKNQKLQYYALKYGLKGQKRKIRSVYKNSQDRNKQNQQIIVNNKSKQKQPLNLSIDQFNASFQIPVFLRENKPFLQQNDPLKLKFPDYKRLYGKKFSRFDRNSVTLEVSSSMDKRPTQQDFFSSKKHLKDSLSANKSRHFTISKEHIPKRLALPKLQGKYKVLDRYQQFTV